MDKVKIVLLTSRYPYNSGEEFLEPEVWNESVEREYYIYATDVLEQHISGVRRVPSYAKAKTLFIKAFSFRDKIWYIARSVFSIDFIWCLKDMIKRNKISFRNLRKTMVFLASGRRIFDKLCRELKDSSLDTEDTVLYSYWSMNILYACLLAKRKYGYHVVTRSHDGDVIEQPLTGNYSPLRRKMLEEVDVSFAISLFMKEYICENLEAKSNVIISHIGTEDYGTRDIEKDRKNQFVIVSCASVYPIKRIELIAETLSVMKDYSIKWVHFGGGQDFEKLKQIAENIPQNVQVELRGSVSHDTVMNYYKDNDVHVFVNVSTTEGIPVSVMEAMSFGIPAIATNVGGTSELVDDTCGLLLDKDLSVNDLAQAFESVLCLDSEDYLKLRKMARLKWESEFCGSRNFRELNERLLSLLNK